MLSVETLSNRNVFWIPTVVTLFAAANKKHGDSARVKCVQNAPRRAFDLDAELSQVFQIGVF